MKSTLQQEGFDKHTINGFMTLYVATPMLCASIFTRHQIIRTNYHGSLKILTNARVA